MTRRMLLASGSTLGALLGLEALRGGARAGPAQAFEVTRTDAEWRSRLTPAEFAILRGHGTEPAFSSPLDHETRAGRYDCAGCDKPLFSAQPKFDSGTGWPRFWQPLDRAVGTTVDNSVFMQRTEIHCARCGGHLGHVFDDGPRPTGLRYCMNGTALRFQAA